MCQIFTPLLINAKGAIVQVGSVAGVVPYVFGSVYNASKAALHSYSNTLRVELAPFDVRVVTIVTGGVKSNIARTERQLPKDSIYVPIEENFRSRQVHSQASGIPNEQYAASVVRQLLANPKKDTIWEGGKSWLVWFASSFFPRWIQDEWMTRTFQLWKLRGTVTKKLQ
jgi:1-acylglycerone phosphate reductase